VGTPAGLAALAALLAGHGVHSVVAESSASRALRDDVRRRLGKLIEVRSQADAPPASWEAPAQAEAEVNPAAGAESVARAGRTRSLRGYLKPRDDFAYSPDEEREVIKRLRAFGYL